MQPAFESAQKEGNDDGKGQNPLPGEVSIRLTMSGDEIGMVDEISEIGQDVGMKSAEWVSSDLS